MRIEKWIDIQREIEIDLSADDISMIYREHYSDDPKSIQNAVLSNLNGFASYLKGIPDEVISDINEKTKEIIFTFLNEQTMRFKP